MTIGVEIFKGDRNPEAAFCCGAEVTSPAMSSCCGTQDIPDDIMIHLLKECIEEEKLGDRVTIDVTDMTEKKDDRGVLERFWQHCEASGISRDTHIEQLLPLVMYDKQVKYVGRIPTGDEFVEDMEELAGNAAL
ncbi:MAG: hypothetical protein MJE77_14455 [Proteobacteria bacterium]|nr:hypothetical protein [Pseudomonadota bacterium]